MWKAVYDVTEFLWGTPLMILMVGVGLYLTVRSGFFQIAGIGTWWKHTVSEIIHNRKEAVAGGKGELGPFQALCTVLAGTVGSGNIAGVAAAIAVGGPGSVFWMWLIALVGMMTKMTEVTLSAAFRKQTQTGEYYGGPMYYIRQGLGKAGGFLAGFYAIALLIEVLADACFIQPNTLAVVVNDVFGVPLLVSGIVIAGLSLIIVLSGGVKKIGAFCEKMILPMIVVFVIGTLATIFANITRVPEAFSMSFRYAFAPAPAVGGFVGSSIRLAMARGAARGIFSNEAGMVTAATVHATAKTGHPVHQGMYGILEVFIDTIFVCTLTALAILCSGVWSNGDTGVVLTFDAFRSTWGTAGIITLALAVILFTYSSYLGFFVEYRTCVEYLFGEKVMRILQWLFFALPILAVTMDVEQVWDIADMAVGFIVIPNMIALLILSLKFFELFRKYKARQQETV